MAISLIRALCQTTCRLYVLSQMCDEYSNHGVDRAKLVCIKAGESLPFIDLAFLVGSEQKEEKIAMVAEWEAKLPSTTCLAVTSDSVPLTTLQQGLSQPDRCLIVNWTTPVETTLFCEIVYNEQVAYEHVEQLESFAKVALRKDPHSIKGEIGYRGRLLASLVREAAFLIDQQYATIEDIDRACRNDSGYYLPFAGNLRYMDLMGTYAYGKVMEELNPELDNSTTLSETFKSRVQVSQEGETLIHGFYSYEAGERARWDELSRDFGKKIRELMDRYPASVTN